MGLVTKVENPLLKQMITELEAKMNPQQKADYMPIVVAGMKILFDDSTHSMVKDKIKNSKSLVKDGAAGAVMLIGVIAKEAKGKMKVEMAVPAAITLLCYIYDFIEDSTGGRIDQGSLAKAVQTVAVETLKLFGIDQKKFANGIQYARDHQDKMDENGYFPAATGQPLPRGAGAPPTGTPPAAPMPQGV